MDYLRKKEADVTNADTSGELKDLRIPLAITHGDDEVNGEGAIVLDWSHIHYTDDIHVEGENIKGYAFRRFNADMKTAEIIVWGDFKRNGEPQLTLYYGKQVGKLGAHRIGTK